MVTFAGISSSKADQQAGKNEHLRSFEVTYPKRKRGDTDEKDEKDEGKISFTSKTSLFKEKPDGKAFQRLIRLSPVTSRESPKKRLCVAATGMAQKNEVVVFDATTATPAASSVCARLQPPEGAEAVDLDLTEESEEGAENGTFALAYCTDDAIHVCRLKYDFQNKKTTPGKPETITVYEAANPPGTKAGIPRPRIRCLRWLSPHHLLLLQKSPKLPVELILLNLASSSPANPHGKINLRKSLPKSLEVAVCLEICKLDPDPASGEAQILIAVGGADKNRKSVIHVLTLDHRPSDPDPWRQIWQLHPYTVLNDTHSSNIMRLAFSNFFPPRQNPESTMSVATPAQYVQLASVAWGGTVVLDTFTLTSTPTKPHDTTSARTSAANPRGTPSVRWVLTTNSMTERLTSRAGILVIAFGVLITALLLQSYITLTNGDASAVSPFRNVRNALQKLEPPGARNVPPILRRDGEIVSSIIVGAASAVNSAAADFNPLPGVEHRLKDLLAWRDSRSHSSFSDGPNAQHDQHHIHVRATSPDSDPNSPSQNSDSDGPLGLTASLIAPNQRAELERLQKQGAKRWEELSVAEKEKWKRRLREAGEYGEHIPETVLKGVFWSEFAGVVGGGLRDALVNR